MAGILKTLFGKPGNSVNTTRPVKSTTSNTGLDTSAANNEKIQTRAAGIVPGNPTQTVDVTPTSNATSVQAQQTTAAVPVATAVSDNPTDYESNRWPNGATSGNEVDTGYKTSDDDNVISAYSDADTFYNQINANNIIDNTPSGAMSYQGYLAYNNLTDPRITYQQGLDAAQQQYANGIATYGQAGEALAQNGLVNSGYSDYLNGVAYAQKVGAQNQAYQTMAQQQAQYGAAYGQYKQEYEDSKDAEAAAAATSADTSTQAQAGAYAVIAEATPTTTAEYSALKQSLIAQGYDAADIDAAIVNYKADQRAGVFSDIENNINSVNTLESGNVKTIRQTYGEGEDTEKAVQQLQTRNGVLVDEIVSKIISGNIKDSDFETLAESIKNATATTDEDGNQSYAWDSMTSGDKTQALIKYLYEMKRNEDITEDTYIDAIKKIFDYSIETEGTAEGGLFVGKDRLSGISEVISNLIENISVNTETENAIIDNALSYIEKSKIKTMVNESDAGSGVGAKVQLWVGGDTYSDRVTFETSSLTPLNGKAWFNKETDGNVAKNSFYEKDGKCYFVDDNGDTYTFKKFNKFTELQSVAICKMLSRQNSTNN